MRPSRAAALDARYQLAETSVVQASDSRSRNAAPGDQDRQPDEDNAGEPGVGGAVMADDVGRLAHLFRWCGMALVAAGVLMVVATLLHPSRETATTIVASEPRLVAAHVVYTLAWLLVLLGLPGLYAAQPGGMGRLGMAGFLTAFSGTYLIAVTGNFGFLAPVLAKQSPAVLDSINQYMPVVIINGLVIASPRVCCSPSHNSRAGHSWSSN